MEWSDKQKAIFNFFEEGEGNLVVRARAGSGKTTTIVQGINHAPDNKILLAAFNKKIATELQRRLANPKAQAKTLHSLGFGFVMKHLGKVTLDAKLPWKERRARSLATKVIGSEEPKAMVTMVGKLMTLGREMMPFAEHPDDLLDIAFAFDCVPEKHHEILGWDVYKVCDFALKAMREAKKRTKVIDFTDMIYLPVVNNWAVPSYDLVCIDECQDMNTTQLHLALRSCKPSGRIVVVGDECQAIYGFRGADSGAIDRLKEELHASELPLNITYRCPKKVVNEAQRLVPDFECAPDAPEGTITSVLFKDLPSKVTPGDFVLSRTNAALTKTCMELLRNNIRAKIEGRDIGKRLQAIAKNLSDDQTWMKLETFAEKVAEWEQHEVAKALKADRESRAQLIADQAETLRILSEGLKTVKDLLFRIDDLFGEAAQQHGVVVCSTVHKAKGLEANRVFILRSTLYPGSSRVMSADRMQEEKNIEYVAVSRAKKELTWVTGEILR